jgi:hypothetical protein
MIFALGGSIKNLRPGIMPALSLVATVIMLDQHGLFFADDINDLADDDLNAATVLAVVDLRRTSPTPIEQRSDSGHAHCWRRILGARNASQHLDAHFGVRTRERAQIGWDFLSGQMLTGWVYPLLLARASGPQRK